MPIYKVHLYFNGHQIFEVEAPDDEQAEEAGIEMLQDVCSSIPVDVIDAVVTLSDCQYTDQQELEDRERDHNINEDDPREDR